MRIKNKCKPDIFFEINSVVTEDEKEKSQERVWESEKIGMGENSNIYLIVIVLINYLNSCMTIGTCTRL